MSAEHTPGPWAWEEGQPNITKSWNGKDHQVACVDYRKLAWHEDSNCAGRESGANARLIAAAPELLSELKAHQQALSMLLDALEIDAESTCFNFKAGDGSLVAKITFAELQARSAAAINKATGATP